MLRGVWRLLSGVFGVPLADAVVLVAPLRGVSGAREVAREVEAGSALSRYV
jgi:hypothetical protein